MPSKAKAVIFTHIRTKNPPEAQADLDRFCDEVGGLIESCMKCDNIGIVFAYASFGIEQFVKAVSSRRKLLVALPYDVIDKEGRLCNAFFLARDKALRNLSPTQRPTKRPEFIFVGVRELASLLNSLWRRNPELVRNLAGAGNFTYDSPKFVEAVIRLVRGTHEEAMHPVIRIDADVEVNRDAIQKIIDENEQCRKAVEHSFWWFSGSYSGNFPGDPANDHAVRQHWLIDPATRGNPLNFKLVPQAETFLRDLGELGATQVGSAMPCSAAGQDLIRKRGGSVNRKVAQVISGAGLVASTQAIRRLPPFMNAEEMIVWIDDHLKRQLHEAIGDISESDTERIDTARFKQDRYPNGIKQREITEFSPVYFSRLIGGCLIHAMIKNLDRRPGPLAEAAKSVIENRPVDQQILYDQLLETAEERLADVLDVWSKADYGDESLIRWTSSLTPWDKRKLCKRAAKVGSSYIRLLRVWGEYVNTIQSLDPLDAYWLFTPVHT
jgi:hypothetical protein